MAVSRDLSKAFWNGTKDFAWLHRQIRYGTACASVKMLSIQPSSQQFHRNNSGIPLQDITHATLGRTDVQVEILPNHQETIAIDLK